MWVTANKMGNYMPYIYTYNRKIEKKAITTTTRNRERKKLWFKIRPLSIWMWSSRRAVSATGWKKAANLVAVWRFMKVIYRYYSVYNEMHFMYFTKYSTYSTYMYVCTYNAKRYINLIHLFFCHFFFNFLSNM